MAVEKKIIVLLLNDEPMYLRHCKRNIEGSPIADSVTVLTARDLEEAEIILNKTPHPDLMISDLVVIPGENYPVPQDFRANHDSCASLTKDLIYKWAEKGVAIAVSSSWCSVERKPNVDQIGIDRKSIIQWLTEKIRILNGGEADVDYQRKLGQVNEEKKTTDIETHNLLESYRRRPDASGHNDRDGYYNR